MINSVNCLKVLTVVVPSNLALLTCNVALIINCYQVTSYQVDRTFTSEAQFLLNWFMCLTAICVLIFNCTSDGLLQVCLAQVWITWSWCIWMVWIYRLVWICWVIWVYWTSAVLEDNLVSLTVVVLSKVSTCLASKAIVYKYVALVFEVSD